MTASELGISQEVRDLYTPDQLSGIFKMVESMTDMRIKALQAENIPVGNPNSQNQSPNLV